MAKKDSGTSFLGGLLVLGLYKRNQGRLTRQVTAAAIALVIFFGAWTLSQGPFLAYGPPIRIGIPLAIAIVTGWITFRAVNYPRFADFLISVEAEMDKVSWSSRQELIRSTIVVVSVMVFLGAVLLVYDIFWQWLFQLCGILEKFDG